MAEVRGGQQVHTACLVGNAMQSATSTAVEVKPITCNRAVQRTQRSAGSGPRRIRGEIDRQPERAASRVQPHCNLIAHRIHLTHRAQRRRRRRQDVDLDEAHPPHLRHMAGEAGIAMLGHECLHHLLHALVQVIGRHLQHFTHGLPRTARRHRQHRQADQRQYDRIQIGHPVVPLATMQHQRQYEGQHHRQAHQAPQQPAAHIQPQQCRLQPAGTLGHERGHAQVAGTQQRRPPQRRSELHFVPAGGQADHRVGQRIHAGQRQDHPAQRLDHRLQVPIAVLEARAVLPRHQPQHRQRHQGQGYVDQAVDAVEQDGLRSHQQATDEADRADRHGDPDRELQDALLARGIHRPPKGRPYRLRPSAPPPCRTARRHRAR